MKFQLKFILLALLLSLSIPVMASQEVNFSEPSTIVLWLTPVLTLIGTWALKFIPAISGTLTLIAVPIVSALISWVTNYLTGDSSYIEQILAGVGAVWLHQLYEHLTTDN